MEGVTTSVPMSYLGLVAAAGQATNWTLTKKDVLVRLKHNECTYNYGLFPYLQISMSVKLKVLVKMNVSTLMEVTFVCVLPIQY